MSNEVGRIMNNCPKVYLAGPIEGKTVGEAIGWRVRCTIYFEEYGVMGVSPLRGMDFLSGEEYVRAPYAQHPMATSKAITTRDRNDVRTADVLLVNLLGMGSRISIGTMIELGWADVYQVPVVLVRRMDCISKHPIVDEIVGFETDNLEHAQNIVLTICNKSSIQTSNPSR